MNLENIEKLSPSQLNFITELKEQEKNYKDLYMFYIWSSKLYFFERKLDFSL